MSSTSLELDRDVKDSHNELTEGEIVIVSRDCIVSLERNDGVTETRGRLLDGRGWVTLSESKLRTQPCVEPERAPLVSGDASLTRTCHKSCRNLTRTCHNLTRICHNLTRTCHNLTRTCHNLTQTCHNLTRTYHNLTRTCYNLTRTLQAMSM